MFHGIKYNAQSDHHCFAAIVKTSLKINSYSVTTRRKNLNLSNRKQRFEKWVKNIHANNYVMENES